MHVAALLTAENLFAAHGVHALSAVSEQLEPNVTLLPGAQMEQGVHEVAPVAAHETPRTHAVHTLSVVGEQAEESTAPEAQVDEEQGMHGRPLADQVPAAQARQESEGTSHA